MQKGSSFCPWWLSQVTLFIHDTVVRRWAENASLAGWLVASSVKSYYYLVFYRMTGWKGIMALLSKIIIHQGLHWGRKCIIITKIIKVCISVRENPKSLTESVWCEFLPDESKNKDLIAHLNWNYWMLQMFGAFLLLTCFKILLFHVNY